MASDSAQTGPAGAADAAPSIGQTAPAASAGDLAEQQNQIGVFGPTGAPEPPDSDEAATPTPWHRKRVSIVAVLVVTASALSLLAACIWLIDSALKENRQAQVALQSLRAQLKATEEERDAKQTVIAERDATVAQLREQIALLENKIDTMKEEAERKEKAIAQYENQIVRLNDIIKTERERSEISVREWSQTIRSKDDMILKLRENISELERQAMALRDAVAKAERDRSGMVGDLQQARMETMEAVRKREEALGYAAAARGEIEQHKQTIARLTRENDDLKKEIQSLRVRLRQIVDPSASIQLPQQPHGK